MCNFGYGVLKYSLFFINFFIFLGSAAIGGFMIWALTISQDLPITSFFAFFVCLECVLTLVGVTFFVMSFFGWFGALRDNIIALKLFCLICGLVILVEVAAIIVIFLLVYVPNVREGLRPEQITEEAIQNYREKEGATELVDDIQERFQCCGGSDNEEGYKDWNQNRYFNCSKPDVKFGDFCSVPFSCCKFTEDEYKNLLCGKGMAHPDTDPTVRDATINTKGCYLAFVDYLKSNILVVGGVAIGILVPQVILFFFARDLDAKIQFRRKKLGNNYRAAR